MDFCLVLLRENTTIALSLLASHPDGPIEAIMIEYTYRYITQFLGEIVPLPRTILRDLIYPQPFHSVTVSRNCLS